MGREKTPVVSIKEFVVPANQEWWCWRQAIFSDRHIDNGIQRLTRYAAATLAKGNIAHDLNAVSKGVSVEGQIESQNTAAVWQEKTVVLAQVMQY